MKPPLGLRSKKKGGGNYQAARHAFREAPTPEQRLALQRTRSGIALGWEDVLDLKKGTITCIVMDDTMPGEPVERTITAQAPFDRCNREAAYEEAWQYFEQHQ